MSHVSAVTDQELSMLKGKTVVITGGANGIGRAAAALAHAAGANVAIADLSDAAGEDLAAELKERMLFVKADVTSWTDILSLFTQTWARFNSIDVVLSNAGTHSFDKLLDDELTPDGELAEPDLKSLRINLHGAAYVAKAAVHFFKKQPGRQCQLVFTGSSASVLEIPPLFLYGAAKHGILGLMRSLRQCMPDNTTVNLIAPWMTATAMMPDFIREKWGNLPTNDPTGVAKALLLPALRPDVNGKTFWVSGNEILEIEDAVRECQPRWFGEELSAKIDEGQRALGTGSRPAT